MSIVVIGSINTDLVMQVPHIARRDETVLGQGGYTVFQGGKGANQAVAAATAGVPVYMLGKVGEDDFGDAALKSLKTAGVNCDFVSRSPTHSTGLATIFLDPEGRNAITVAPGANAQITEDDIRGASDLIASADIVMMQLEIPLNSCARAAQLAKEQGVTVMLDPAPAPAQAIDFLQYVDYLTPNEIEAEALTGISTDVSDGPRLIAKALLNMGPTHVAMTLGEQGSFIASAEGHFHLNVGSVDVLDSTGAGDTFNGYLAAALAKGMTFKQAAEIASAAATLSVTRAGARVEHFSWDEVLQLRDKINQF